MSEPIFFQMQNSDCSVDLYVCKSVAKIRVPNLLYLAVSFRAPVPPRNESRKVEAMGIYPGATVIRGPDWRWGDQDGKLHLLK